jgi:hypothetical protein
VVQVAGADPVVISRPAHRSVTRGGWPPLRRLARPLAYLVVARVVMAAALGLLKPLTHAPALEPGFWDGGWYIRAAQSGWPRFVPVTGGHVAASTLAFFPGYPVVIRLAHLLTGAGWSASAEIAATASQVLMVIAVWVLAADVWDPDAADRATLALCFFPGAFVFALFYSEGLMIALAAVCLLALRRRWWLVAGVAAALATATRPNAVALVAACAWASAVAIRERREWRSLVAVVLSPVGIIGWFAYLWSTTGSLTAWFRTEQGGWGERIDPLAAARLVHHLFLDGILHYPNEYVTVLSMLLAVVLFVVLLRSGAPATWVVFAAVVLLMALMSKTLGARPRFVMTAFPLAMVLGARLRTSSLGLVIGASAGVMVGLLVLTTTGIALTP